MSRLLDILSEPRQMAEERDDELSLLQRLVPAILGDDMYKDPVAYKDFAKEVITGPFLFSGELGHVLGNVAPAYIDTAIKNTIHNRAMGDDRPLFEGASELIGEPEDYVGTGDQFWDMLGAGFADTPNSIRARVAASPIDAAMVLAGIKAAPKAVNAVADAARTGIDNLTAPRTLNTGKYHGQRGSASFVDALTETRRPVDYATKGGKSRVGQPKPGGGFYGAPDSIRTAEDLAAWDERRLHGLEQGVRGRDWYKNISEDIYKMTGGDVDFGDQMALATAITSNQSKVPDELAHAVRGVNQALVGDPVKTGRFHGWDVPSHYAFENPKTYGDSMSYKIEQLFDSPIEDLRGGMKTDPYALNKSVEWRPELASQRPVNDEHMVSAFEYNVGRENPLVAPSASQHRWMDIQQERIKDMANERQIGGFDDWDYSSEQAAQWVYEKGLKDYNAAVKKSGKAPHELDYYIDQASRTYREIIQDNPQLLAYITRENIPGESTGHMSELLRAERAERDEFSDVIEAIIAPEGTDRLTSGTNTLTWGTLPNEAAYEGAANKGYITPVLVTKEMGGSSIDPSAAKLLDADAAAHSIFNPQQQVAWNYVPDSKSASAGEHAFTGLTFDADGPMDVDAFRALQSDLNEIGIDTSMVDQQGARALVWEPVVDKPDGDIVTFNLGKPQSRRHSMTPEQRAKFNADMKATDRKALLKQAKKIADKHGVKLKRVHTNTNIFPVADDYGKAPDEWSVKPFVEAIEAAGPGHVARFDKNVAPLAKPMLDEVSRIAKQRGYTMAEWYKPMMEGLAEGGLSRLKELVQAGVVPAAALAVFLPMLSPPATSGDNPSQS
jgi:hypothetical protein